jgi:hypothetical protein
MTRRGLLLPGSPRLGKLGRLLHRATIWAGWLGAPGAGCVRELKAKRGRAPRLLPSWDLDAPSITIALPICASSATDCVLEALHLCARDRSEDIELVVAADGLQSATGSELADLARAYPRKLRVIASPVKQDFEWKRRTATSAARGSILVVLEKPTVHLLANLREIVAAAVIDRNGFVCVTTEEHPHSAPRGVCMRAGERGLLLNHRLDQPGELLAEVSHPGMALGLCRPSREYETFKTASPAGGVARPHIVATRPKRIAGMASHPMRAAVLPRTVDRLLAQVDELRVYLNGYADVPAELARQPVRVFGLEGPDRKDNGKFHVLNGVQDAFVLTVDDDLEYPVHYAQYMVDKVEQFGRTAGVGMHGALLPSHPSGYLRERATLSFEKSLDQDQLVHLVGTGTLALHSDQLGRIDTNFPSLGMTDIWFAIAAKAAGVPLVCPARPAGFLQPAGPDRSDSLYWSMKRDDSAHTAAIRAAAPWPALPSPLTWLAQGLAMPPPSRRACR